MSRYIVRRTAITARMAFTGLILLLAGSTATAQGPTVHGNVYGGGNLANVGGSVTVNMTAGTVDKDVYGGGALANTNTNNWNADGEGYELVSGLTAGTSVVTGLYTKSGESYTKITEANKKAEENTDYYEKIGAWADRMYDTTTGATTNTTAVNLTGGMINGDAYGGGLGRIAESVHYTQEEADAYNSEHNLSSGDEGFKTTADWLPEVKATVYGDINVNLGSSTSGSSATGFYITNYTGDHSDVIKSGRIFGCNNLNGSPKGDVRVTVYKTVPGKDGSDNIIVRTTEDAKTNNKEIKTAHPEDYETVDGYVTPTYEVAAVYGGGNLANYTATGKKAYVRIETCDVSIESVYGGGNAAEAPETNVLVRGTYEINEVFGGGNGKDPYTLNGTDWIDNSGADVRGNATTLLTGGLVHGAYGGSNKRGTIFGNVSIDTGTGSETDHSTNAGCPLDVEKLVGAGKDADVNGDLIMVMGCKPNEKIPVVYAGADNANVNGDVMLTITSGKFGKVFGGNNAGGYILGRIRLNIEETADCNPAVPIEIDELYLGGNEAEYSMYGYYNDGTAETPVYKSRTAAMDAITDPNAEGYTPAVTTMAGMEVRKTAPYAKPELNIISCTKIDKVYGGGFGAGATLYGDPIVNINMIPGQHTNSVSAKMTELGLPSSDNSDKLGIIGDVFGGGNAAKIEGSTTVNIGTATTVNLTSIPDDDKTENVDESLVTVKGAYIVGNVYGGGNEADVTGNTFVNICAKKETDGTYTSVAFAGSSGVKITSKTVDGEKVGGNIFGGGKGVADNFLCDKAMIGTNDAGADKEKYPDGYPDGNTNVIIGNGTVNGSVYGGGEVGRVEMNTTVTIGLAGTTTSNPDIKGSVFGGGKGDEEHGYAALVRGNPTVTIQANAKVEHNVYGGGEIASVARYKVPRTDEDVAAAIAEGYTDAVKGRPYALKDVNSGFCTVNVLGNAVIGPDTPMEMYHKVNDVIPPDDAPDDAGHVFGAGKGILPKNYAYDSNEVGRKPRSRNNEDGWDWFADVEEYIAFIKTLALSSQTTVTIGDENDSNPFVKGSVYGGSENGIVQFDTNVNIKSGQIGCGKNATAPYGNEVWIDGYEPEEDLECASWDYGMDTNNDGKKDLFAPYDPNANATGDLDKYPAVGTASAKSTEGGRKIASDGHTYYGNVFGGGSGSVPYFDTAKGVSQYIMSAGWVKGNTNVTISGGHILTNVYGGNEATNVDGTATVKMTGGTIGVPRTLAQIDAHPVTCYLFGAGKGDQRIFFNKDTNVKDAVVEITGGKIYGSVFGGGEDGHVLRDVKMTIGAQTTTGEGAQATTTTSGPIIGTWGTSYVDGNVFGGGRGFGGDAYTAGNVAGSIKMEIKGGTMLGSIYGGGRLASVGYGLYKVDESGYGLLRSDNMLDNGTETTFFTTDGLNKLGRGHIDITISGGTIGNNLEYIVPKEGNIPSGLSSDYSSWEAKDWVTWLEHNHISKTLFDTSTGRLMHTKGGNVFTGGMGRREKLDGVTPIPYDASNPATINWHKLGNAKTTKVTISGTAWIKSNVYGGGELGAVRSYYEGELSNPTKTEGGNTEVVINGGTIGSMIGPNITGGTKDVSSTSGDGRYTFGSVYGGGYGTEKDLTDPYTRDMETFAALILDGTKVTMNGGTVLGSVFGGGELACVGGSSTVEIKGGTVGVNEVRSSDGYVLFGGSSMGNVYGGGSGSLNAVNAGLVRNNTTVNVSGSSKIYHNIYGGGAYGSVGWFTFNDGVPTACSEGTGTANVTVSGGQIGINGYENGMVFGSSRGDVAKPVGNPATDPNDKLAWVRKTHVVIGEAVETSGTGATGDVSEPKIMGTVYGSGENGHVFTDTQIDVLSGTIGIVSGSDIKVTNGDNTTKTYSGAAYPNRGNVYGGGCGTDMYDSNGDGTDDTFNPLAGIVLGNATVNINGGTVVRNVYGAGAMGSVGKTNSTGAIVSGGLTTITISGGQIGVDGTAGDGNVFGAARGDVVSTQTGLAQVKSTTVSMSNGTVWSNIYGGGEAGNVGTYTNTYTETGSKNYIWDKIEDVEIGDCSVSMTGGEVKGHVFGAGKGEDNTFECEKAMVRSSSVSISNGTVDGNVYGGGEVGRVDQNAKVEIGVGTGDGPFAPTIKRNVFGAGAGKETHGYSALVRGNTEVIVEGNAKVEKSVYGGGEIAAVGRYGLDVHKMPTTLVSGGECKVTIRGKAEITNNVFGAGEGVVPHFDKDNEDKSERSRRMTVYNSTDFPAGASTWEYYEEGSNFVWDYFQTPDAYLNYLQTLALATDTKVTIDGEAKVKGSVYGGSESGFVQRYTDVKILSGEIGTITTEGGATTTTGGNVFGGGLGISENETAGRVRGSTRLTIIGGTMHGSVYGGGALGKTNTEVSNDGVYPTATVNLLGGIIDGDAYGGGLGDASTAADAGNTVVNLNGLHAGTDVDETTLSSLTGEGKPLEANGSGYRVKSTTKGIVVGRIFGSNNLNGTPKGNVLVHVHSTQNGEATQIANTETLTNAKVRERYDVDAVYGGGNLAAYNPVKSANNNSDEVKAQAFAEVIIDGCNLTSIKQVYGGGNAASVPATHVVVNGTYEIEEVFGGGNGLDMISKNGTLITNPGANVGFKDYWDYAKEEDLEDYNTKDKRLTNTTFLENYVYGSGKASVDIYGGLVHRVFGGSNTRGNVRETAVTMLQDMEGCDFKIDEAYGGGKSAPMDAEAKLLMACIPGLSVAYGGAQDADVQGGVTMTITNGTFDRVFGGNNISGTINGPIVVNIEETGCRPIVIGQLYGGGNQAAYTALDDGEGPTLNVHSFTSIGEIYGGGYGETAVVKGDTHVNIDVTEGKWASKETTQDEIKEIKFSEFKRTSDGGFEVDGNGNRIEETKTITVTIPGHNKDAIGAIGNVFGGGNAAKVDGNTNVNIGTRMGADEYMAVVDVPTNVAGLYTRSGEGTTESPYTYTKVTGTSVAPSSGTTYYKEYTIKGADIRGNVYGGGNNADVTGNTNVVIGKKAE